MKTSLKSWIVLCFILLAIPMQGWSVAQQEKKIYQYDPQKDSVVNEIIMNHKYGVEGFSYEKQRGDHKVRVSRFFPEDIVGKTIIDFGCNEGGILFACADLGAKRVIGVDYNEWCIGRAQKKAKKKERKNATFLVGDMENKGLFARLPQADTVFLLAILDTSHFANRRAVLTNVSRMAKRAFYYEGHCSPSTHVKRMYEMLLYTPFTRFEYLGRFEGRIFIRCGKELIDPSEIPAGAVTSDSSEAEMLQAEEIYVFTDSSANPPFSSRCRLIQYVKRNT